MNANFKPLGLAAAVATATAGFAGVANAQMASVAAESELGDLAIVPYYTVMDGYATGVNIINTSDRTQVLKFRFRRAVDSMDALDFNVVLSPEDVYTGFISMSGDDIVWTSNDNSCTVPAYTLDGNKFVLPPLYRTGAETGYIEIISMGSPVLDTSLPTFQNRDTQPIAIAAKHGADGLPASCSAVRDNFFAGGSVNAPMAKGVVNSVTTVGPNIAADGSPLAPSTYEASPDSLKVSYFIKSDVTGVEFGDNAVHIEGFLNGASMTNQQEGLFSGDLQGFDHPDLNGGAPGSLTVAGAAQRGKYNQLRMILGTDLLINDWSKNTIEALGATVDTDWVVTIPGQYIMLDLNTYLRAGPEGCLRTTAAAAANPSVAPCDFRDIPLTATFEVLDREEQGITVEEGDLVVSPSPPVTSTPKALKDEVNVIQWGEESVLNAPVNVTVTTPEGAKFGWASLATDPADTDLFICDYSLGQSGLVSDCTERAVGDTPIVGFVAWQRAFAASPGSNYGRIVEHSRVQSTTTTTP